MLVARTALINHLPHSYPTQAKSSQIKVQPEDFDFFRGEFFPGFANRCLTVNKLSTMLLWHLKQKQMLQAQAQATKCYRFLNIS